MTVSDAGNIHPGMSDADLQNHADTVLDQFFRR